MKKLKKYLEFFITKIHVFFEQHIYRWNGVPLKYILKREHGSDDLLVIFSACTRAGIRARYNYVRTLNTIKCNKLFILDDFAEDHRGGYYLGKDLSFREEYATKALIDKTFKELNISRIIFCGSSKGGYATLNLGCQYPGSYMIPGGPQYFLATYLINDESFITLKHIIGDTTDEKVKQLDAYLPERIKNNSYIDGQKIYLHYSNIEHTYDEHIHDLIQDLQKYGYIVEQDISNYGKHSDISYYYPDYLFKTLTKLLTDDNTVEQKEGHSS